MPAQNTAKDHEGRQEPDDKEQEQQREQQEGRTAAQVVTTLVSVLLLLLLIGAILYDGYASGESQPAQLDVEVHMGAAEQRGDMYYVPYRVTNRGDETVEVVLIAFEVRSGDEIIAETETTIQTLGERAEITGSIVLADDPATLEIDSQVMTFQLAEE